MANTYNDGTFTYKRAADILSSITDSILSGTNKLNDFTTGSALETLSEAEALEVEELYYLTVQNMNTAINESVLQAFGFERKKATYAYGNVLITLNQATSTGTTIPKGITFSCSNPQYTETYVTQDEYVITPGSSSITVPVYCVDTGSVGNVPSGAIDMTSDLSGISSVTNPMAFQTGTDDESTSDLMTRFRSMILGLARGTVSSLKYAALSVDGITSVDTYEDIYGVVVVYCCDANGDLSADLQNTVALALEAWRPAGINVLVRPVNKAVSDITIALDMASKDLETDDFLALVKTTIESYINDHKVGQALYVNDLISKVQDVSDLGINDCNVSLDITPAYSISQDNLSDTSTVKIGAVDVKQSDLTPINFTSATNYGLTGKQNTTSTTNVPNGTGSKWSDATVTTDPDTGISTFNPISVDTKYMTQSNEIVKSNTISVFFEDSTEYVDYDNYGGTSDNDLINNIING